MSKYLHVVGPTDLDSTLHVIGTTGLVGDVGMSNKLHVVGTTDLDNTLHVVGATDLDSTLNVDGTSGFVGAVGMSNTLHVVSSTVLDSTLHVDGTTGLVGDVGMSNKLHVVGATDLDNTLHVMGFTDLDSTLNVDGNSGFVGAVGMSNSLHVVGPTDLDSTLHVIGTTGLVGDVGMSNKLHVVGTTDLDNTLHVVGATDLDSTLNVDGTSGFVGAVGMSNTLHVVSSTVLDSTLHVDGTTGLVGDVGMSNKLHVVGTTDLDNTLHVVGATDLDSSLNVDGTSGFVGAVGMSNKLHVVGATDLDNTLHVIGATNLDSFLNVAGASGFNGAVGMSNTLNVLGATTLSNTLHVVDNSTFDKTVTAHDLVVTDTVTFSGSAPFVFNNLTVNGKTQLKDTVSISANVGISNNLYLGNTLQVVGAAAFSNTLNVDGQSTFNANTYFGVTDAGVNIPSVFVGIGTTMPTVSLDLASRTDAISIPVGSTAARPTGVNGLIRYNNQIQRFEGYGNNAWSGLGGVVDVNQDTYISAENTPGANNDQLRFFTSNIERITVQSTGNVGIGQTTDPTSGNAFWVTGQSYFNSGLVRMNNNLTVENVTTTKTLNVTEDSVTTGNATVSGTVLTDNVKSSSILNLTAPTIKFNGNVEVTGTLDTINTETITVEDKVVTLASSGNSNAPQVDGGLNDTSGFVIEGLPSNFAVTQSNNKLYEKSLRWHFGSSNGVQSLADSTNFRDDSYWETLGGSWQISRYSSNMGKDFADGSSFDVTKIAFMFRINKQEQLELVKVREDKNGLKSGNIVSRFGIQMPVLAV